jgi:hypothetical protein
MFQVRPVEARPRRGAVADDGPRPRFLTSRRPHVVQGMAATNLVAEREGY